MKKCETCRFVRRIPITEGGGYECRRYPPQTVVLQNPQQLSLVAVWPRVWAEGYCHEYREGTNMN